MIDYDPVKVYTQRFWSLWTAVKKILLFVFPQGIEGCNGSCEQGRLPCDCGKYGASEKKNLEFRNPAGAPENKKLKKRV